MVASLEVCFRAWANILNHLFGVLIEHRVVLYDQDAVVVLFQDGHELEDCKGAANLQLGDVSVEPAEDARVVTADEEDLVSLQVKMAVQGFDQHLHRSDKNIEGLGEQRDCRMEFNFHR